jgi:menaquinone-dependent protoporphyrinogen oxidase
MARILIIHASVDGQTKKICQRIQEILGIDDHAVHIQSVADTKETDLQAHDCIMIGASVRYGRHHPQALSLIKRHTALLESRYGIFFSVNLTARKTDKDQPENNPYLQRMLKQCTWQPKELAVFAGKLDYPAYRWLDRQMIRLIMWITGGPTDPATVREYTDWARVEEFARQISRSNRLVTHNQE